MVGCDSSFFYRPTKWADAWALGHVHLQLSCRKPWLPIVFFRRPSSTEARYETISRNPGTLHISIGFDGGRVACVPRESAMRIRYQHQLRDGST